MTTYWKPRWPHTVLFGSYGPLNYRIDVGRADGSFTVRTRSGPGFYLSLDRSRDGRGLEIQGPPSEEAQATWLGHEESRQKLERLLSLHFSRIIVTPSSIECVCRPAEHDVLPEGPQLSYCLSLLHALWKRVPEKRRTRMADQEYLG